MALAHDESYFSIFLPDCIMTILLQHLGKESKCYKENF